MGLGVPFVAAHHIEAHALSPFLDFPGGPARPVPGDFAALVVSGGTRHLYRFTGGRGSPLLARTRDDAAGEAVRQGGERWAGLGYPGGPAVDGARGSRARRRALRRAPLLRPLLDLSFSGLKTAVKERLKALGVAPQTGRPQKR